MIGQAWEIRCRYVDGFETLNPMDCGISADAKIIDIKFSTCYEEGYGIRESALIIYKEATQ